MFAASAAYALTSGIVGNGSNDGAGDLTPVLDHQEVEAPPTSQQVEVGGPQPADGHDDDRVEQRHGDDEHEELEPHDLEGRDDDD
jgi:hypothetical protein